MKEKEKNKMYKSTQNQVLGRDTAWFDHIYNADELQFYQDFDSYHHNNSDDEFNPSQITRHVLFAINLGVLLLTLIAMKPMNLFIYFSNWTMLITIYSQYLIICAVKDKEFSKSL